MIALRAPARKECIALRADRGSRQQLLAAQRTPKKECSVALRTLVVVLIHCLPAGGAEGLAAFGAIAVFKVQSQVAVGAATVKQALVPGRGRGRGQGRGRPIVILKLGAAFWAGGGARGDVSVAVGAVDAIGGSTPRTGCRVGLQGSAAVNA